MRYSIIVVTAVSGCLFCSIMIFSTISPLPRGDSFNSAGMWINVALLLFVYILSLVFYIAGFNWMKYVMAVFCGLGLLTSLSIVAITLIEIAWLSSVYGFLMFFFRFFWFGFITFPVSSGDYSNSNRLDVFCFRFSYVTFALYSGNFNKYKLVCCCFSKKPTVFSIDYRSDYLL